MQPFLYSECFESTSISDLKIKRKNDHLVIKKKNEPFHTVSSAVLGGGMKKASHFVNWKVPLDYISHDPIMQMKEQVQAWGYPLEKTIGLQTAAAIDQASIHEMSGDQFQMICCVTTGLGNSARAGVKRKVFSTYKSGTINSFIFIDGNLSEAALLNGMITATEAKTAALQDLNVRDDESDRVATGTTTDSVVIASTQNKSYPKHRFAGTATTIGNAIGVLVYKAIIESVS